MKKRIPKKIKGIIDETNNELRKIFAKRLRGIILYGSYARGDYTPESDIDIVLLLDNLKNIKSEREKYLPVISRLSLKHDTLISAIPFDYQYYKENKTPLILNIRREGRKL
jgi:uncharacterized protein